MQSCGAELPIIKHVVISLVDDRQDERLKSVGGGFLEWPHLPRFLVKYRFQRTKPFSTHVYVSYDPSENVSGLKDQE